MEKIKTLFQQAKVKLFNEKSGKYIFILGIVLIILVYFWTDSNKNKTDGSSEPVQQSYSHQLEEKISEMVENITGFKAKVLVTLNSDGETIYADQVDTTTDTTENTQSDGTKVQKSGGTKHSYIIVETSDGAQQALVVTKKNPTIKGVAIVVKNANAETIDKISLAVTTALDIPSSKVCVISS